MIAYVCVGADDLVDARRFYCAFLPALGYAFKGGPEGLSFALPVQPGQSPVLPDFYVKQPFDGRPASVGNGVMIAFEARTRSDLLHIDERELEAADWYTREAVTSEIAAGTLKLPSAKSIARQMIDGWLSGTRDI